METKNLIPITIDLGAKYTGVLVQNIENPKEYKGYVIDFDKENFNYSLKKRLLKRHLKRIKKRKRLVKRLFLLISYYEFKIDWECTDYYPYILGLFNRRGYNFIDITEEEKELLNALTISDLKEIFDIDLSLLDDFANINEFFIFLNNLVEENEIDKSLEKIIKQLQSIEIDTIKQKLMEIYDDKTEINQKEKALKKIIEKIQKLKENKEIAKHRKYYLQDIKEDIKNNKKLIDFIKSKKINPEHLINLIGNLNNLTLKALRKYFNDKKFSNFYKIYKNDPSLWDKDKLKTIYLRWFRSWRPKKSINTKEIQYQKKYIKELKGKKDIIKFLLETSPETTIPPYEIQNNRRPPRCQSLRLNENYLNKNYPNWKKILLKLLKSDVFNSTEIKYKLVKNINNNHIEADERIKDIENYLKKANPKLDISNESIILQIILDQTKDDDPFKIREQTNFKINNGKGSKKQEQIIKQANNLMQQILTGNEIKEFLQLAEEYYSISNLAEKGLWIEDHPEHQILQKCNSKPKLKKNAQEYIIKQILGFDVDINEFIESFRNDKLPNKNKKIKIICKELSRIRDEYKNQFPKYYNKILKEKQENLETEDKKNKQIFLYIPDLKNYFKEKYNLSEENLKRFNSPYTYIQLYDVIEKDTSGFYKTCPACTKENEFRSYYKNNGNAYAKRLPADAIKPIDSQVVKILERKAHKFEEEVLQPIINSLPKKELNVYLILEENNFSFEEQLYLIKKNGSTKRNKYLEKKQSLYKKDDLDKIGRIKEDSFGICAYTGKNINENDYEIDHIIPQSYTKKIKQTSFNHEANLIYVSREGNQKKKNKIYTLKDLSPKYLKKVFGTDKVSEIEEKIRNALEELKKLKKSDIHFSNLDKEKRNIIRHGLFIETLRDEVINQFLTTKEKAIVNGTQKYFIKYLNQLIYKKYKNILQKIKLDYKLYPFKEVSSFREEASEKIQDIEKEDNQSYYSHTIDCSVMMALYFRDHYGVKIAPENLKEFLPNQLSIITITSTPIYKKTKVQNKQLFKDSIYKEDFVPIYYSQKEFYIGFSEDNKIPINSLKSYKNFRKKFSDDAKLFFEFLSKFIKNDEYKNIDKLKDNLIIKFNKQKVQKFLNQCGIKIIRNKNLSLKEQILYDFFNEIPFYLIKQDVLNSKFLIEDKQLSKYVDNYINNNDDSLKSEFEIKINNQKIYHPVYLEWLKLYQFIKKEIKDYKKSKDLNKFKVDVEKKLKEFFKQTIQNPHRHKKHKTIYSLPIIASGYNTLFRIKRYNYFFDKPIFQVISSNGNVSKGFSNNKIAIIDSLTSYKSVPISNELVESKDFISHSEWFNSKPEKETELKKVGITKFLMSKTTIQRPYVRVELSIKEFIKLLKIKDSEINEKNLIIKLKPDHLKKSNIDTDHILFKKITTEPNSNLTLIYISDKSVYFQYRCNNYKESLNEYFNLK